MYEPNGGAVLRPEGRKRLRKCSRRSSRSPSSRAEVTLRTERNGTCPDQARGRHLGFYERWILPRLIDWSMRTEKLAAYRRRVLSAARGLVLEIGVGSGLNLPLYGGAVERVVGLDPSPELLARAARVAVKGDVAVHLVRGSAEAIPLPDRSVDAVVTTWTLCSIPDARRALGEMRRVLKPGGVLLFVEHGLAPEPRVAHWQHRLNPLWTRISCHLDRPMDQLIREAGLEVEALETGYLARGPRPMTFFYEGRARRA